MRIGPIAQVRLRTANSASLLLPVSNLTNLLALPRLELTVGSFALRMAPVVAVVLLVEYVGLRVLSHQELRERRPPKPPTTLPSETRLAVPITVVALMLLGFVVTSPFGIDPAWVAVAAAVVLALWGLTAGVTSPRDVIAATHPDSPSSCSASASRWPQWPAGRSAPTSEGGCRTRLALTPVSLVVGVAVLALLA